eukprot:5199797-Lingulodinium_polyedra.AAC.1
MFPRSSRGRLRACARGGGSAQLLGSHTWCFRAGAQGEGSGLPSQSPTPVPSALGLQASLATPTKPFARNASGLCCLGAASGQITDACGFVGVAAGLAPCAAARADGARG